jgi:ABC-type phosphate/phosphonate transport system ATPase subunit
MVGLQNAGKTSLLRVLSVRAHVSTSSASRFVASWNIWY